MMLAVGMSWYATLVGSLFITHMFLTLDEIACQCENPFGHDTTDLALVTDNHVQMASVQEMVTVGHTRARAGRDIQL